MPIDETRIADYLERYAATLTSFDADAAAALWAEPGVIVDDAFSGALDSRAEMAEGLRQSFPLYRRLGLARVDHEVVATEHLTDRLVLVHVRWIFRDADGEVLTDSRPRYLLRDEDGGLVATVCIQTDDLEQLQTLAADRGIDLAAASRAEDDERA